MKQWLGQYPDLADELASFLSNLGTRDSAGGSAPPGSSASTIGRTVGPYIDLAAHARGGLGEVYRAPTRPCIGPSPSSGSRTAWPTTPRAADASCWRPRSRLRLEHPGVVPVFGLFLEAGDRPAYAMRFVQGPTLWDALQKYHAAAPNPLAFRHLLQAFVQVCQTVAYAHSRGIIHRDLKPQNIMIGKFGESLVMDWGLAKIVGRTDQAKAAPVAEETLMPDSGSGGETMMGSAVGTPAYMSPEQAAGRWDIIAHAADVYGLGAVLYALLTNKPPLEGGDSARNTAARSARRLPAAASDQASSPQAIGGYLPEGDGVVAGGPLPFGLRLGCGRRGSGWPTRPRWRPTASRCWRGPAVAATPPPHGVGRRRAADHGSCGSGPGLVLLGQRTRRSWPNATPPGWRPRVRGGECFPGQRSAGPGRPRSEPAGGQAGRGGDVLAKAATAIEGNSKFADKPAVEATLRLVIGKTFLQLGNLPEARNTCGGRWNYGRRHSAPKTPTHSPLKRRLADFLNRGPGRAEESEPLARADLGNSQTPVGGRRSSHPRFT